MYIYVYIYKQLSEELKAKLGACKGVQTLSEFEEGPAANVEAVLLVCVNVYIHVCVHVYIP